MKNIIKIKRAELNISQCELAKLCNLTRVTISRIESGKNIPSGSSMARIACALNSNIAEIFLLNK